MSYPSRCMGVGMAAALTEVVCGDIQDNVTAAGSTQGTATLVAGAHVIVTTAAASTGVILPPAVCRASWPWPTSSRWPMSASTPIRLPG